MLQATIKVVPMRPDLLTTADDGARIELHDPTAMPQASTFLWNPCMLVQFNCRGYVTAQHMQPEPAKYSHAPVLEQTTFMQPEQPAYAHHPGRFVYLKDEQDGSIYSAPYAPVQRKPDRFVFSVGREDVRWIYEVAGIALTLSCHLPARDAVERPDV